MPKLKPGDAFIYSDNNGWIIEGAIKAVNGDTYKLSWWHDVQVSKASDVIEGGWRMSVCGSLPSRLCKPHPDPDRLWADYTAARLLDIVKGD